MAPKVCNLFYSAYIDSAQHAGPHCIWFTSSI